MPGSGSQRGAALLTAVVFVVIAIPLSLALLAFAGQSHHSQVAFHETRVVHAVLRAGIITSVNEINRGVDKDGDGLGFLGTGLHNGSEPVGVPVFDGNGRLLGTYRATVEETPDSRIVTVVAAAPDLAGVGDPTRDNHRFVLAAKLELGADGALSVLNQEGNALCISGHPGLGGVLELASRKLTIIDGTYTVPAINITDREYRDHFAAAVEGSWATVEGADVLETGVPAEGADTISNQPVGVLTQEVLLAVGDRLLAFAQERLPGALPLPGAASVIPGGLATLTNAASLPDGTYACPVPLLIEHGGRVQGQGTLIVNRSMAIGSGGRLEWDGDILVISTGEEAALRVASGGRLDVTGTLLIHAVGEDASFTAESGSRTHVDGAFLALAGPAASEMDLQSGSGVVVNGLLALLGDGIDLALRRGSDLTVAGSVVLAVPAGSTDGLDGLTFERGTRTTLAFHADLLEQALDRLDVALFTLFEMPEWIQGDWAVRSYYEPPGWHAAMEQQQLIEALRAGEMAP